jgi:hypothetical protein
MTLVLDAEVETLARRLAVAKGKPVNDVVKEAIKHSAQEAGLEAIAAKQDLIDKPKSEEEIAEVIRKLNEIAARSAARPVRDPRNPHEIIEYDEWGLPV